MRHTWLLRLVQRSRLLVQSNVTSIVGPAVMVTGHGLGVGQKEPGQKEPHTLGQKVPGIGQKEPHFIKTGKTGF